MKEVSLKNAFEVIEGYRIPYRLVINRDGPKKYKSVALWHRPEYGQVATMGRELLYVLPGGIDATYAQVVEWIRNLKHCKPVRVISKGEFKSPLVQALKK